MDKSIVEIFATWQAVVVCLSVWVITYITRTVVETLWRGALANRLWAKLALPILPLVAGAIVGLCAKQFPWPDPIGHTVSARVMMGTICGLFCGWIYAKVRDWLKKEAGLALPSVSPPPNVIPPPPPVPDEGAVPVTIPAGEDPSKKD